LSFLDHAEKRKLSTEKEAPIEGSGNKKMKIANEDSAKKGDILDAMLKNASFGYGENGIY